MDTRFGSAVGSAVRDDQGWLLKLADEAIVARAVVWATGRSWRLARCFGAKLTMHGHLAAYTRFFDRAPGDCSMVVEARPEGWWYSADLRVPHRSGSGQRTAQSRTLVPSFSRNAVHRAARAAHAIETASMIKAAGTAIDPAAGDRWVAAGDCLFCADPLSSRGIVHALRSGILAAYAASDMLDGRGDSPAPAMQNRHTRLCRLAPSTGCPLCSRRAMGHAFLAAAAQPCLPRV
ncbi:hypothetical protein [Mesorhizobium sp. LNHC229A00]|uniref:NAD(P)/FAD-dependent oxidoreductase n=1 Tax=Mesorhizobium sp. LNHC229A00 TaxID=1287240 RepID=UPI0012EC6C22|nr:hypothetical protein [Mesorhizobium sp. LNHC229A00]